MHAYVMRVRTLVASLVDTLTPEEIARVNHLVDHGEAPDALISLAAIIVNRKYTISTEQFDSILVLVSGTSSAEFIPGDLKSRVKE